MRQYWVVGGEYTDTSFERIIGGGEEEWAGPFATYEEAAAEWSRLAWQTVDNCHARYRIVERPGDGWRGRPRYWVVGGEYTDTSFERIAGGGREEWFGPFETYESARAEWARLSALTAHICHARYRVVRAEGPPGEDPPPEGPQADEAAQAGEGT